MDYAEEKNYKLSQTEEVDQALVDKLADMFLRATTTAAAATSSWAGWRSSRAMDVLGTSRYLAPSGP